MKKNKLFYCILYTTFIFFAFSLTVEAGIPARGYPGVEGFCNFDSNWKYKTYQDESGKTFSFYEATSDESTLPSCPESNIGSELYVFKGWTTAPDRTITAQEPGACINMISVGTTAEDDANYVPCYEMVPHVRLATNGGEIVNSNIWSLVKSDGTFKVTGASTSNTVSLPELSFSGYYNGRRSSRWKNTTTGEEKNTGDAVPLDGSIWSAIIENETTKYDLYKTVRKGQTTVFSVENIQGCAIASGSSSYLSVIYNDGDCTVTGLEATPFEQFVDVTVDIKNGLPRIYKFSVEDITVSNQNGNNVIIIDTSSNVVVGENDASIANGVYTDQCTAFTVSNTNYSSTKASFARSKKTGQKINSGAYHVKNKCTSDNNDYIAFCLDPGRRGPGEMSGHKADYIKTSDVNIETDFGKLIAYVVRTKEINNFDRYGEAGYATSQKQRVAAHVAIRISAIKNGFSAAVDASDLVYRTHYYPYEAVAQKLKTYTGDISYDEAIAALDYETSEGNGFNWGTEKGDSYGHSFNDFKAEIADILSGYDGTNGSTTNAGFSRTIDQTTITEVGENGYSIQYTGTMALPYNTKNGASLTPCATSGGVTCTVNQFVYSNTQDKEGRKIYNYKVTISVDDAYTMKVPTGSVDEKNLSFKLTYDGSALVQSAFIANPSSGSDNLQRMLIITTTTPDIYLYFNVVPNVCDLPFLDKNKCTTETDCTNNRFNGALFVAAGCCRYLLNGTDYQYLTKKYCEPTCTNSTLAPACSYTANGKGKANIYTIREGEHITGEDSSNWEPNIGSCVAQVSRYYLNDSARHIGEVTNGENFIFKDDGHNVINVEAYTNNRYCQVTCKEDWEIALDAFGNYTGKNAVAAGTYFQMVGNDMFISGSRTCYTSFINYDRFMANVVDLSADIVDSYNNYSKWSHVWTDVNKQKFSGNTNFTSNVIIQRDENENPVCVEYFDECPDKLDANGDKTINHHSLNGDGAYFWDNSKKICKQVPHYNRTTTPVCTDKPTDNTSKSEFDVYSDTDVVYDNGGANNATTKCTFTRYSCPKPDEPYGKSSFLEDDNTACEYYDYEEKNTKAKVSTYELRITKDKEKDLNNYIDRKSETRNPLLVQTFQQCRSLQGGEWDGLTKMCYESCPAGLTGNGAMCYGPCPDGYISSGNKCYKAVCPSDTVLVGDTCYIKGSDGCPAGTTSFSSDENEKDHNKYCRNKTKSCPSGTTEVDEKCYINNGYSNVCPSGYKTYEGEGDEKYCRKNVIIDATKVDLSMAPKYITRNLTCKTYAQAVSYSLKTTGDEYAENSEKKDVYYKTTQSADSNSYLVNIAGYNNLSDNNNLIEFTEDGNVQWNYGQTYTHKCTIIAAKHDKGAIGSSTCEATEFPDQFDSNNKMFCEKYATITGTNKDQAFCWVGASSSDKNVPGSTSDLGKDNFSQEEAFNYIKTNFLKVSETKSKSYKNTMSRSHSSVYDHAIDIFKCQHFQLYNNTDSKIPGRGNNVTPTDVIMNQRLDYVQILTEFDPIASYEYNEKTFMDIIGKDNLLEQFTEKNEEIFEEAYAETNDPLLQKGYEKSSGVKVPVKLKVNGNPNYETELARNYIENYYYNPSHAWSQNSTEYENYRDTTEKTSINDVEKSSKTIVMCTIYAKEGDTVYKEIEGKEGAMVSIAYTKSTPEWNGGRCYPVTVDYKKVHYVKSSITNSSYYKNKGYWYVGGGDVKEHGNGLENALEKANTRVNNRGNYNYYNEEGKWARLGQFNVFPISMGTPKNLYQYSYQFGQIGSYSNGDLGRIMGTTKAIIKNNTHACFYEVYEDICLCCGYKLEPSDLVEIWVNECGRTDGCPYQEMPSDTSEIDGNSGRLSLYSNSVSLGNIRGDKPNLAENWTSKQKFMYNGNNNLTTEKGYELKQLIEKKGQTIYSDTPEYAYYLTPDILQQIRDYNDNTGYELNYDNLKLYESNAIECSTTECNNPTKDEHGPVITFQHYGSKFLANETSSGINLDSYAYGSVTAASRNICAVTKDTVPNVTQMMEENQCRWIDYIEPNTKYRDPVTNDKPAAFRLAFK